MTRYDDGRRTEWLVRDDLAANGYELFKAAGSKGIADLIAIKPGQVLLVNVKRTRLPSPAERAALIRVANLLPGIAVPLIARKPPRQPIRYERVIGVAVREPWTPDEVAA